MKRTIQALTAVYALLCLLALLVIAISALGWFGLARAPLNAVFAIFLAAPWSLALQLLREPNPWEATALLICAMTANVALLFWLAESVGRRRGEG